MQFREVRYYQLVRPPTLNQFLWRRYVADQTEGRGVEGVVENPETGAPVPRTALHMQALKGVTAAQIAAVRPDWVAEYHQLHPPGGQ